MNKTTSKKILGGTLIVAVLATIGAVLVTAETNETLDEENMFAGFKCGNPIGEHQPFFAELTEEQREEIHNLRQQLKNDGVAPSEIRQAINDKLEEYGIRLPNRDDLLDMKIEQTTQRLEILELQKDLRDEGNSWEEIEGILEEDYNFPFPPGSDGMMMPRGGRNMHHRWDDIIPFDEELKDSDI